MHLVCDPMYKIIPGVFLLYNYCYFLDTVCETKDIITIQNGLPLCSNTYVTLLIQTLFKREKPELSLHVSTDCGREIECLRGLYHLYHHCHTLCANLRCGGKKNEAGGRVAGAACSTLSIFLIMLS